MNYIDVENIKKMNMIFEAIGFNQKTIEDHFQRLGKIIFVAIVDRLDKAIPIERKKLFPEMKQLEDFYNYYEEYLDRETISKVMQEESFKVFNGYFESISKHLPA